jgi:predicted nucleic acid-binding protein
VSAFLDTNILVYAQQTGAKAHVSQKLLAKGGMISAQVLNELVNVLHRKLDTSWTDIERVLDDISNVLDPALPVTAATNRTAVALARDHVLHFYDALIVASAIEAGCDTLFSEDLQHGRRFGGLRIVDPFR